MEKEYMINRLRNSVIPERFSNYPIKWYRKLTEAQLVRMCEEIVVDGPTVEDYMEEDEKNIQIDLELSEEQIKEMDLRNEYPTFPYRFNPETNDLEVYTESGEFEVVYD